MTNVSVMQREMFPIILPPGHWLTILIVENYPEKGHHISRKNQALAELTFHFVILDRSSLARRKSERQKRNTWTTEGARPNLLGNWWRLYQGSG